MHGVIHVTNGALPRTDAQNQALGASQMATDLAKAARLDNALRQDSEEDQALAGAGNKAGDFLNFYPGFWTNIVVRVGQKLTFTDADRHDPHTVTFGPEADPTNPFGTLAPYGNPNGYDGRSPLNSGFLFHQSQYDYWNLSHSIFAAAPAQTHFTVSFTQPGLYTFYCAIHGSQDPATGQVSGMSGPILVLRADDSDNSG